MHPSRARRIASAPYVLSDTPFPSNLVDWDDNETETTATIADEFFIQAIAAQNNSKTTNENKLVENWDDDFDIQDFDDLQEISLGHGDGKHKYKNHTLNISGYINSVQKSLKNDIHNIKKFDLHIKG